VIGALVTMGNRLRRDRREETMDKGRVIRCFDYVNHPYARVCEALTKNAPAVFQKATTVAETRADDVASQLRVQVGSLEVGTDITIVVRGVEDIPGKRSWESVTKVRLEWQSTRAPRWFPLMQAELSIYPLTTTETQLDFLGHYEPPLGVVGSAIDAAVGHRIAEAAVHRFVDDVAEYLRRTLSHPSA
jgi:hypothetical protein